MVHGPLRGVVLRKGVELCCVLFFNEERSTPWWVAEQGRGVVSSQGNAVAMPSHSSAKYCSGGAGEEEVLLPTIRLPLRVASKGGGAHTNPFFPLGLGWGGRPRGVSA
jgi:hypothetical protein